LRELDNCRKPANRPAPERRPYRLRVAHLFTQQEYLQNIYIFQLLFNTLILYQIRALPPNNKGERNMKRIISSLLSLTMLLALTSTAFATDTQENALTYKSNEGIIAEQSISEDTISNLPESMKLELQKVDGTLVSVSTTYFDLETGAETRAVMPESDFKLTVAASRLSDAQIEADGVHGDAFEFVATGEWLVNPLFEFTDCIGITWSDDFTLYYDTGYAYTKDYYGYPLYNFDALTLNDAVPEQGFAYDANLLLFDRQDEITIIGRVYKDNDRGSANVCATYGHVVVRPSSIDVSFSSGKEIGMSVGFGAGIEMASPDYDYFDY